MRTIEWLVIGSLLVSPAALAQEANPYSGTWDARMVSKKGETRNGAVIIKEKDGTWDFNWQSPNNPCVGKRSPIAVQRTSAEELVFEVQRSKALKGCKDSIVTLKRVNETTLKGELDDGRKLTLMRK
jgi:hypothetical protein